MIVADTSCISALAKVRRLDLLTVFEGVFITKGVFFEVLKSRD